MALEAATATVGLSFLGTRDEDLSVLFSSPSNSPPSSITQLQLFRWKPASGSGSVVVMAKKGGKLGMAVFEPFEEVKKELDLVPSQPQASLALHKYSHECEAAVNHQINVEYNVSYVYHAMYSYFDRDNVALKGFAKFFKESSEEEREHAEILMEYQSKRGGRVKLQSILFPNSEYDHAEKGDALYAMELALSLEKLTNENLLKRMPIAKCIQRMITNRYVADKNHDMQLSNFIQSKFLDEQVKSIKKIAEYVAQLRRVGKGHGVWRFDRQLLDHEEVA